VPARLHLLGAAFGCGAALFIGRLFQLQVVEGERWAQAAETARVVVEDLPPLRGRILDRGGMAMADTRTLFHAAVVFADLELTGRRRRTQALWRLDDAALDALVADFTTRLRWIDRPQPLREVLLEELAGHPGVAVRTAPGGRGVPLALIALPRVGLAPGAPDDGDPALLAAGDLLGDDPRRALEAEVRARRGQELRALTSDELRAACARLDADFGLPSGGAERTINVIEPATAPWRLTVPVAADPQVPPVTLDLRLLTAERRAQAEDTLARVLGEDVALVRERLARALAAMRQPPPRSQLYYAAAADGDAIAPLLPSRQGLAELPLGELPGARGRVLVVQGDPVDGEGVLTGLARSLGATLGLDPDLVAQLIVRHGREVRPATCERDYRVAHIVLDPARLDRLVAGLSQRLTVLGRTTTAPELIAALAEARGRVDRAWAGQGRGDPVPILRDLPTMAALRLMGGGEPPAALRKGFEADAALPGLTVLSDVGRAWPFPASAPHLLGRLGRVDDGRLGELLGQSGLERRFDQLLRGTPGRRVTGRTPEGPRVLRHDPPLRGGDLITELDLELQELASDAVQNHLRLAEELGSATPRMRAAAAVGRGRVGFVLIDCRTGGILASASSPGWRLDEVGKRWKELSTDPGQPLIDHAATAEMAPGSSFKILTALAGLELGVLTPGERVHCPPQMAMHRGRPVLRNHGGWSGEADLVEAIRQSHNTYFAVIGQRIHDKFGPGKLPEFAARFGLGRENALDVDSQMVAWWTLPTPEILPRMPGRRNEPRWIKNDTWRMAIGQFCSASPLQVVTIAAAVANGGHIVAPHLVQPDQGATVSDLNIRQEWLDEVRRGMERVTDNEPGSTARLLQLEGEAAGIKVAAKTGTSEWGSAATRESGRTPDNGWMIGYAPADRPTVAFACFVHSGTFGGQVCTPIVKRVLERYFAKYGRAGHLPTVRPVAPAPTLGQ
jgi:penicillin-binding protein 2